MCEKLLDYPLFQELKEIIGAEDFLGFGLEVDHAKETIVGEMNDFEKALLTLGMKKGRLRDQHTTRCKYDSINRAETRLLECEIDILCKKEEALIALMWVLIEERLENISPTFGIRENFQIVAINA